MSGNLTNNRKGLDWYTLGLNPGPRTVVWTSLAVVYIISLLDLAGWIFNITLLTSIEPQWTQMKIVTAICLMLAGAAILVMQSGSPGHLKTGLSKTLALIIIVLSLITLMDYMCIMITGHEAPIANMTGLNLFLLPANRMAFLTAVNFLLIGCMLFLFTGKKSSTDNIAHLLIFPAVLTSSFVPIFYILRVYPIFEIENLPVALNTGIGLTALCTALVMIRPDTWLMKVFTSKNTGGLMARRLLPGLIIITIIIAWLITFGIHSNFFKSEVGVALIANTYTVFLILLVWFTASYVNLIDEKRRLYEEELIKSRVAESERKRFNDVLDLMPAFIILLTPDYHVPYANRYFRERFGESNGRRCYEFLFDRSEPCEVCDTFKVLKSNQPQIWEWLGPDNRNYSIHDFPFTDTDGSSLIMEMGIDVTELKQAETKLLNLNAGLELRVAERTADLLSANELLKKSQEMAHVGSWELDLINNKLTWSDEVYRIFGLMPGEFSATYEDFLEIIHPEDRKKVDEAYSGSVREGTGNYEIYHRIVQKHTGEIRYVYEKCIHFRDTNGKIIRSAGMIHDITETKKAREALISSETNLRAVLDATQESVYMFDRQGKFVVSNLKGAQRLKLPFSDFIGHPFSEFVSEHVTLERFKKLNMVLDSGQPVQFEDERNGMVFNHNFYPVFENDQVTRVVTYSQEITEHRKIEKDLFQVNLSLNSLFKSSQAMIHAKNESDYLDQVCRIIVEECGHAMVWIGFARDDMEKSVIPVAYSGFDEGYIKQMKITWADTERGRGPTGTAIRQGKPVLCSNMLTDPAFEPWKKEAVKRGYASSIVLPLVSEGKSFGAISIYSNKVNSFSENEITLLSNLADDLAYGIAYIRLQESEKKATEAIKESEVKYRMLFEGMTEGFALNEIIINEKGEPSDFRFLSINPAFEIQTGLKAENITGRKASEILPGLEKYWIESFGKVALTGKSIKFKNYLTNLNRYFRVTSFSPGKGFFAVMIENITSKVQAENELYQTKNYLENLINYSNTPIIVWNTENQIQLFNRAFEHLTGYSSAEVEGKKLDFLFPNSSLKESREKIRLAITENLETIEIPIMTKNSNIRTVLWNSAKIYDNDRKVISTIAQGSDITERIKAEQAVEKAMEKLDMALENGNIGIWEWDIRKDTFELDKRMKQMFGLEPGSTENTYDAFEKHIYEDDLPHMRNAFRQAIENDIPLDTVYRIKLNNEKINYISSKALVEKDNNGMPVRMSGVCFDITDMKKGTEKALFILNENLLRSNKELEQFAYIASHDLQEPLRMVSSFTQLLSQRYKDKLDQDAQEFIQFAVDGANRMQGLINDLLEYSRIETRGKKFSPIDMHHVLGQTLKNLSLIIKEKNALVITDELPNVVADEGQMVQLFQNLVGNALKFCTSSPIIHISGKEENDGYLFTVHDNGIGIEPQYFNKIFQIFQRLQPKDAYGGTGIGLSICKRIVERHGGKIWVESIPGKGSDFYFTLIKTK